MNNDIFPTGGPHSALISSQIPDNLPADLEAAVRNWLEREVALGDPREDTIKTYTSHLNHWLRWCNARGITPAAMTQADVESFRHELIQAGMKASSSAVKLTVIRRFYQVAMNRGLIAINPAANVRPPVAREAKSEQKHLTAGQAELLIMHLPVLGSIKGLRDRAIIALMLLEGLRRVEIKRANVEDIEDVEGGVRILVHGKRKDGYIYPREDTVAAIRAYLAARGEVTVEEITIHHRQAFVTPMFLSVRKNGRGRGRISRIGLNSVIDGYLSKAGLKRKRVSCHALRHTCGTMLYDVTKDIRAVQDTLRHEDISTSAIYAASGREHKRFTRKIPLAITTAPPSPGGDSNIQSAPDQETEVSP